MAEEEEVEEVEEEEVEGKFEVVEEMMKKAEEENK